MLSVSRNTMTTISFNQPTLILTKLSLESTSFDLTARQSNLSNPTTLPNWDKQNSWSLMKLPPFPYPLSNVFSDLTWCSWLPPSTATKERVVLYPSNFWDPCARNMLPPLWRPNQVSPTALLLRLRVAFVLFVKSLWTNPFVMHPEMVSNDGSIVSCA